MNELIQSIKPVPIAKKTDENRIIEHAKTIIEHLEVNTPALARNDIAAWRMAHQMALNVENPKRQSLYNIYEFTTELDTHTAGVVQRTKLGVIQRRFKLVDASGTENKDLTKILQTPWFVNFMSLALDAEYYGHSLIEFGDVIRKADKMYFADVKLVPRNHVVPEFGVIVSRQGDDPKTQGLSYRDGNLADWCLEAGTPKNLGLYLKVSVHVISKKHVQIFWDNFAERFGIPLIYATTETRNTADRVKIENMLKNMGNSAWGYFPNGTVLTLLETAKGDAFQVFDQRIIRANKEISIGLAGQTMAFEDGSSRSQAEVHEHGFDEIKKAFAQNLAFLINYSLLPLMVKHGFPVQNHEFQWDYAHEYSASEMQAIEQMLLNNYEVDPDYFVDKYGIPILGIKAGGNNFFGLGRLLQ
ncbi:MAG: DUF935 domain-containing protein [Prevotellaceae bacterium]|jgi:hypothetical protein|nr:DUF935 domain-containing protein [Prevotellaceae bacterium]